MKKAQLLAVVVLLSLSCSRGRPVGPGDVAARKAMVASAHPAATAVGIEILMKGGNAVDAAVAVAFALSMAEPNASGVGGGGFMVVRMAGEAPVMIDYRESAPAGATPERYSAQGVDFAAIKFFALGLIRQYVVGYGEFLEALFCLLVPGVEIGMQFFRQAAVSLLDVIRGGGARDPQNVIWVFHFRSVQQNVP